MDSWPQLLLKAEEVRPFSYVPSYEIAGPLIPGPPVERSSIDVEIPVDAWFTDYKKSKVTTNLIVQFINDFPIQMKSGIVVIKLEWTI